MAMSPAARPLLLIFLSASLFLSVYGDDGVGPCPVRCFIEDPVCGEDGVTYSCGYPDAACAGVRVAKRGLCAYGSGGIVISGQAFVLIHIVWLIIIGFFGFL